MPQRLTKAQRKEQARKERLELERKQSQKKRRRRIGIIVGSVLVAGAIAAIVLVNANKEPPPLPGMMTTQATTAHPWLANSQDALIRADKVGLPALGNETFHHHDLLQIFVHGDNIQVPADIGINSTGGASMHTHDTSGIMHLETDNPYKFTLGQFFDVWGLRFDNSCIGGYCSSGPNKLRVYVNGNLVVNSNVRDILLTQHDDVVVTYGTTAQLPSPIPKTYSKSISSSCGNSC
jgi:hypothetical protein